jgi:O-antigen/teichoic acid export membrane protein
VITKWVDAGAFGIWKQFGVTSGFVALLATLGTAQVIHRYLAPMERPERFSAHFFAIGTIIFGVASVFAGGLTLAPQFFGYTIFGADTSLIPLYLLAAYIPILALVNRLLTFLKARRCFDVVAPLVVARDLGSILLVSAFILLGGGVKGAIGAFVFWEVLGGLATFELARRKAELKIVRPDFSRLKRYLSFGLPLILVTVGSRFAEFADRYVIVNVMGIEDVGIYSVAYAGGAVGVLFLKPFTQVLLPDFSVLVESGEREQMERRLGSVAKYFLASQVGILILIVFLGRPALVLVSTESFAKGLPVLKIIPIGIMAYGLLQIGTQVLNAEESTRLVGGIWIGVGILNVAANLIAVPALGLIGAGLVTVLSYAVGAAACWGIVFRSYTVRLRASTLLSVLVATVAASLGLFLCMPYVDLSPILTLTVGGSLGVILYLSGLIVSGFVNHEERDLLRRSLSPRVAKAIGRASLL